MINTESISEVCYISFEQLSAPTLEEIRGQRIEQQFKSEMWTKNFEAITLLRRANKHYSAIFLNELFPKLYTHIIEQVENLRSNNSKEALILQLENLDSEIIKPLVSALFVKSSCDKAFLRNQALESINILPKKYNQHLMEEFGIHAQSNNGNISELAARIIEEYVQYNKITELDGTLCGIIARLIAGKRAVLQKKGRQLLLHFKSQMGEEKVLQVAEDLMKIEKISNDELMGIVRELKREEKPKSKGQNSFKQFLKSKKM